MAGQLIQFETIASIGEGKTTSTWDSVMPIADFCDKASDSITKHWITNENVLHLFRPVIYQEKSYLWPWSYPSICIKCQSSSNAKFLDDLVDLLDNDLLVGSCFAFESAPSEESFNIRVTGGRLRDWIKLLEKRKCWFRGSRLELLHKLDRLTLCQGVSSGWSKGDWFDELRLVLEQL